MRIQQQPPLHLTYCMNIHPGETWDENLQAIKNHALQVKKRIAPNQPFGLGLRLSRMAAETLHRHEILTDFHDFLRKNGLYVFTINGFPYGRFHGTKVKEQVYAPDWRTAERRDYTCLLADILADLLPEETAGSISTAPGSYKPWIQNEEDVESMTILLTDTAEHLHRIHEQSGKEIVLGLEPEPDCYLESAEEGIDFFRGRLLTGHTEKDKIISRHLGICLDTAHTAMRFRVPADELRQYADAGIRIAKIQLSAALESTPNSETLQAFNDPVYLHQVTGLRPDGSRTVRSDLPELLEKKTDLETVRVHYHLPLYFQKTGEVRSTAASTLTPDFFKLACSGITEHLEIETYTFGILPGSTLDIIEHIVREYEWALTRIQRASPSKEFT